MAATHRLKRAVMALAGIAVGLTVAEYAFRVRDDHAFPHLNVYTPDATLGVRLAPGATETFRFADNPVTQIRINHDGYRGADWPAAHSDDVIVVGDSQTFGLGVEETETFSALLGAQLHRTVLDAGVPTYGPGEYRAVAAELLEQRHAHTVIVGINLVNDLFEASHPNRERHAVWDGWAVRRESAPDEVRDFPGRSWLYRESHLFFAIRKAWHHDDPADVNGVASEGTWTDLVARGRDANAAFAKSAADLQGRAEERRKLERDLAGADAQVQQAIFEILKDEVTTDAVVKPLLVANANPGDILEEDTGGEEARAVVVTSAMIKTGAEVRAKLRGKLAAWTKAHAGARATDTQAALATTDAAFARLAALDTAKLQAALDPPLLPFVRDLKALCDAHGARLVVVVLPIDVQVSPAEWAKYGAQPIDMQPTRALTDELVAASRALGVTTLDTTPVLAAAEPGAFLDRDIHMTPKGHAAVAAALAKAIAEPPPIAAVASVPVPALWAAAAPLAETDFGCETRRVRDWLRISCVRAERNDDYDAPWRLTITHDETANAMSLTVPDDATLLVPVSPGQHVDAELSWYHTTRVLHVVGDAVTWEAPHKLPEPTGDGPNRLGLPYGPDDPYRSPVEKAVCKCWGDLYRPKSPKDFTEDSRLWVGNNSCAGAYGATDARCTTRYATDCARMFECMWRDPASPP